MLPSRRYLDVAQPCVPINNLLAGKDYPKPIVDHDTARKQNLDRMSLAFAANKQLAQVRYDEGR